MITENNLDKAKNLIKNSKEKLKVVRAQNLEFNRKILEFGNFDVLIGLEFCSDLNKDKLKSIDSGFNHFLARVAKKNGVAIGFDMNMLRDLDREKKALIIEKYYQNIRFCKKAKCKVKLVNYKDEKCAFSFLISLGAHTKQAKEAIL